MDALSQWWGKNLRGMWAPQEEVRKPTLNQVGPTSGALPSLLGAHTSYHPNMTDPCCISKRGTKSKI